MENPRVVVLINHTQGLLDLLLQSTPYPKHKNLASNKLVEARKAANGLATTGFASMSATQEARRQLPAVS